MIQDEMHNWVIDVFYKGVKISDDKEEIHRTDIATAQRLLAIAGKYHAGENTALKLRYAHPSDRGSVVVLSQDCRDWVYGTQTEGTWSKRLIQNKSLNEILEQAEKDTFSNGFVGTSAFFLPATGSDIEADRVEQVQWRNEADKRVVKRYVWRAIMGLMAIIIAQIPGLQGGFISSTLEVFGCLTIVLQVAVIWRWKSAPLRRALAGKA